MIGRKLNREDPTEVDKFLRKKAMEFALTSTGIKLNSYRDLISLIMVREDWKEYYNFIWTIWMDMEDEEYFREEGIICPYCKC